MEPIYDAGYAPNVGEPTEKITIHISCRHLADLDTFTVSDPVCHVYIGDSGHANNWKLLGKTEQIENNLNPDFVEHFEVDYYFEKEQRIKIWVYDVDITELEHIGDFETTIGAIMGSINTTQTGDLFLPNKKNKSRGKIILRAEKVATNNDIIYFTLKVKDLISNKGLCWFNDDPFYYIERARGEDKNEFLKVIQSEPLKATLNPNWVNQRYLSREVWNGDYDWPLRFKFYSWRNSGYHKFYGEFETSVNALMSGVHDYNLTDKGNFVGSSVCTFEHFYVEERPSFFDFLHSGWKINMIVAVDYTASNGEVTDPRSLHYVHPNGAFNDYQEAIRQIGSVLEPYDYNKQYAAFGFGGIPRYAGLNQVSHCFHLNGRENPEVDGVAGILEAYQFSLFNCGLYGPTNFGPCLRNTVDYIKSKADEQIYHIYVILTDGDIHDMPITKDIIVEGSDYPLSIVIIGLGESNFTKMIELDGDDEILRNSEGRATKRDIVQFVKFNEFRHGSRQALAEEVLEEVPEQVISYLVQNNIKLN